VKILVIGSGGREHALAWRLAHEGHHIYGAPGNPGIAEVAEVHTTNDYVALADRIQPDLTVVGPEGPLVAGVADQFRNRGFRIVGATREMAQLESSKIYAKQFMHRLGIPTARFEPSEKFQDAIDVLQKFEYPIVVKADGLAAGKGVIIAKDQGEAEAAIQTLGPVLVIEEFLQGEEVSFIALSDGSEVVSFQATQDHKAVWDGDTGPNTGGMGAYCDGRILSDFEHQRVLDTIIEPTIRATGFSGFLYAGLMMTTSGPKVLEFNVRLGDPETQPLMHHLDATSSFAEILMRAATGTIAGTRMWWRVEPSVCVVLAAAGYPETPRTGDTIQGMASCGAQVFQAATRLGRQGLETAGGRVLGVTASGRDLPDAIANTYAAVNRLHFDGMHYRHDIGEKGLKRWRPGTI
jgi:phosphoribosylamine--glycine ligase